MISDDDLYRLAIFLGSCAMMMIVLYHFLDVNSSDESADSVSNSKSSATTTSAEVPTSGNGN
ncbi:Oligosaccaryltransferase [Penicillium brevicompactum]|uniref:Dolichyl-diphosphooligosaccharide--protein glycosyltransferase subunit 4 n=1 Tax=Penicillium brevicompactum TaxID=5074 RepID=A0A9W9R312_PENBR|nr:Oligosaccaryltransferase [Penicillium brevicompactum]